MKRIKDQLSVKLQEVTVHMRGGTNRVDSRARCVGRLPDLDHSVVRSRMMEIMS